MVGTSSASVTCSVSMADSTAAGSKAGRITWLPPTSTVIPQIVRSARWNMGAACHHLDLPRPAYQDLLAGLVHTVTDTDLVVTAAPAGPAPGAQTAALVPASRREELLTQAVRMFAAHGYTQVSIEDIGHAVGISGPSVYNHWPNKLDLLVTALRRGAAALAMDVATVYRLAPDAAAALRLLIGCYVALSQTHHETIGLLITDIGHLPDGERHAIRRAQRDFVSEWVHLLRLDQPQLDPTAARIRVHAALSVANDIARTPHLRRDPSVPAAVETLCTRLLGLPEAGGDRTR
jgi:AcrR family transcriptional regulator